MEGLNLKVEFLNSDLFGTELFISASEFKKAKADDIEYESLEITTEAFGRLFDIDYIIGWSEYKAIFDALDKNGAVHFVVCRSKYPEKKWCEIYVTNDNKTNKICYMNDDGEYCVG